jgi:hypothetical protein
VEPDIGRHLAARCGDRHKRPVLARRQRRLLDQRAARPNVDADRRQPTLALGAQRRIERSPEDLPRLIERQADPADGRARRVVATRQGAALLATLKERLQAAETRLLSPLDEESRRVFRDQVRLLAIRANASDAVADACQLVNETRSESSAS